MQTLLSRYLALSLGLRIAISTVAGAIGTSSLVGFVSEYAAVSYALSVGARLPTEGVPYLQYGVTSVLLLLFLLALSALFGTYWLLSAMVTVATVNASGRNREPPNLQEMPLRKFITYMSLGAFASTQLVVMPLMIFVDKQASNWAVLGLPLFFSVVVMFFARKPQWLAPTALATYLCSAVVLIALMFMPAVYEQVLKFIRFGGGVQITLEINCKDVYPCSPETAGALILRTKDYFFLKLPGQSSIVEVPVSQVTRYSYPGIARWGSLPSH